MQERDAFKLQSVGCNQWSKQKIMADIYGCPSDALPQSEPADADDEDDFDVKLESLKNVWEKAAPAFHEWFRKTRSQQFKDSLIMSARPSLGITLVSLPNSFKHFALDPDELRVLLTVTRHCTLGKKLNFLQVLHGSFQMSCLALKSLDQSWTAVT